MFQSLRTNSSIYIFHKGQEPYMEIGYVSSISTPRAKYQVPTVFGQSQEMVVDLIVKIGDRVVNFSSLPAQLDIADSSSNGENIVISGSKEAMNSEILSLKQKSIDILNSCEFHKCFIANCDKILSDLNPEFAEKQAQRSEINDLKQQICSLSENLNKLMESNKLLVEQLNNK